MFNVSSIPMPELEDIEIVKRLDHEIKTRAHITLEEYNELEKYHSEEERMKSEMDKYEKETEEAEEDDEEGELGENDDEENKE